MFTVSRPAQLPCGLDVELQYLQYILRILDAYSQMNIGIRSVVIFRLDATDKTTDLKVLVGFSNCFVFAGTDWLVSLTLKLFSVELVPAYHRDINTLIFPLMNPGPVSHDFPCLVSDPSLFAVLLSRLLFPLSPSLY